jgi:RimJ/RimL family protein N-acetyltransferase
MNIHTKRLLLVPLGPQYLISTHEYAGDIDNTKYMVHMPNIDISETKGFLDGVDAEWQKCNPQYYEYAILLNNEHIGAVSIYFNNDYSEGELGWIINKKYWGNGYATEAAKEIMHFAMQELKVRKFIAHCDSQNISSYKVMEKLGMSLACRTQGRKNKLSDEDREELMYSLEI